MKNFIFFLALILTSASPSIHAMKLFKCELPVAPFDPSFQQGQELYLDVYLDESQEDQRLPRVHFYRSVGPITHIHQDLPVKYFGFSNSHSSFLISWRGSESYLSMVYLGGVNWGAYLKYEGATSGLPSESELHCKESTDVTLLPSS